MAWPTGPNCLDMPTGTLHSPRAVSTLPPPQTTAVCDLKDLRGAVDTRQTSRAQVALAPRPWLVQRHCAAWACVWMPNAPWARLTPLLLPAAPRSAACTTQDPAYSHRGASEALSPRVAQPSRPWHGQRDQTAWTCPHAPYAALETFLRSRRLRRLRSATSKTIVSPLDRADQQGPGCAGNAPMACGTALRCLGAWISTECTVGAVDLFSAARWLSQSCMHPQDSSCSDRGARPSVLGLRCHRAHGMANVTKLLGHANSHLTQPPSSCCAPACSDSCGLPPQAPLWRRWTGQPIRALGLRRHRAHGSGNGTALLWH